MSSSLFLSSCSTELRSWLIVCPKWRLGFRWCWGRVSRDPRSRKLSIEGWKVVRLEFRTCKKSSWELALYASYFRRMIVCRYSPNSKVHRKVVLVPLERELVALLNLNQWGRPDHQWSCSPAVDLWRYDAIFVDMSSLW